MSDPEMNKVIETAGIYKDISEERVPGISEIKRALHMVSKIIQNAKYPLYGGMAVDFALKLAGHKGIYAESKMPDYDILCPDPVAVSFKIRDELARQFEGVKAINAMHLNTRRVRINDAYFVADISFLPEPYFSQIPRQSYQGFIFVHPDYQRIDMHRAFCHLYEGAPGREVFRNRTAKDIKRFLMIQEVLPIKSHDIKPITTKNLIFEHYDRPMHAITLPEPDETICLAGWAALALYEKKYSVKFDKNMIRTGKTISNVPDPLEYISAKFHQVSGTCYEKCMDFIYEAKVDTDIVYNGEINLTAATKLENYNVVSIHYLCMSFLFRYFMLGTQIYLDVYKFLLTLPLDIEIKTFGKRIQEVYIYAAQKESCKLQKKEYEPRPWKEGQKPEDFITYQIAGRRVDALPSHSTKCPI